MTDSFPKIPEHTYSGAQALIQLHDLHLRSFVAVWKRAKAAGIVLPKTEDPDYASLDRLLRHVVGCARGYMVWMCKVLELPDPGIEVAPQEDAIAGSVDAYVDHVLAGWKTPLAGVEEERFHRPEHASGWNVKYCVDAMMEHAVMHPIRHEFQLRKLLA